jgi:TonB family protein
MTRFTGVVVAASLWMAFGSSVYADDSVSAARDLYASASYSEALTMLNRMEGAPRGAGNDPAVDLYKALCLFALGRTADADRALEEMIGVAPAYRPSNVDMPPRVNARLLDARRRVLPSVVQQRYAQAKAAFDRTDYPLAEVGFRQMLETLGDPDISAAASQPPLSELKVLAVGFRDLSASAMTAAAKPQWPLPGAVSSVPQPIINVARAPRIHNADEAGLIAPVIIDQRVPSYPSRVYVPLVGSVEVVIAESGEVESATIKGSIDPRYDDLMLAAAKRWRYKPAMANGEPVKYRKRIEVRVAPQAADNR